MNSCSFCDTPSEELFPSGQKLTRKGLKLSGGYESHICYKCLRTQYPHKTDKEFADFIARQHREAEAKKRLRQAAIEAQTTGKLSEAQEAPLLWGDERS